ncbi:MULTISPECIES: excinuclease ABC subunit UvrB [unclassified Mycoplasma]|uniref:excinuclease ABC subunit UvrB n=1 Tax=unclassified Mycoplasma TaxID=2683645 RepID=UPI00211CEB02|nr:MULTISPECIES: excinuclease ABC subunit UvrB [unclassified Mycoplasma]UUM19763.1 excinuclease ABC subunit UvrB [Mycoplasma sp. 1578d]UUM24746.1 excinuclease ABC subunit UvrB [Mycoplasma sp. 3686d]
MSLFKLHANYKPSGDQPKAINEITQGIKEGLKEQVLLGVTGSGKTYTIANVIKNFDKPVLILSHTKTLASQLYSELKTFFPENAVEYFISYFDYYRPEAYMAKTDTYIEKDSKTNEQIEILRLSTINSILTRKDTIVVASVSAIYGALNPEIYKDSFYRFYVGQPISIKEFIYHLVQIKYERNDFEQVPGKFTVKGDLIFVRPADSEESCVRISFFGDEIEEISLVDPLTKNVLKKVSIYTLSPGNAYATSNSVYDTIIPLIEKELQEQISNFTDQGKILEATRISQRVKNDIDDMREFGMCKGIENYSMYLDQRTFGQRPYTILDYFPKESLMFIDESHMFVPQLHTMYSGDRSRKESLVNYGFRLPSALENRPLRFDEWENNFDFHKVFISATPGDYELDKTQGVVTRLYVRPTGLVDPEIIIKPAKNQMEDIFNTLIKQRENNDKTIILTLTKKSSEELSLYLSERGIKAAYIHSEYNTFERNEILRKLRKGIYETVIGINLLREGIDLPEVSKVIVLDADKEGFTRNYRSLIQITGRAARNSKGQAIFYADKITKSMQICIDDNKEKRAMQLAYNKEHNIVPKTIIKAIPEPIQGHDIMNAVEAILHKKQKKSSSSKVGKKDKDAVINELKKQMNQAAQSLDYERAIELRDLILELQTQDK